MWKYRCRNQFFMLLGSFAVGFMMAMLFRSNTMFQQILSESLPPEALLSLKGNPILINISAGLGLAGMMNIFTIGNLLSIYYSGIPLLLMFSILILPEYAILLGIVSLPVMLGLLLYGWISLRLSLSKALNQAKISGDDEIVQMYLLHHDLNPKYEALALEAKKTILRINVAYILGLIAIFCVLFFLNNLFISMILVIGCMIAFQYLARLRASCFSSMSMLLVQECDPEACLSALIYYGRRGNHYRLKNRALMAQCLIYLNEPELARDVLIEFPRSTPNNLMAYYSLMGYIYYLLKDESGLIRCRDDLNQIRPKMGAMGMVIKSEEVSALENKINLMQGDFNTCKKYFLNLIQRRVTNLQKADCDYYIALISFVQEDFVVAKLYFERTLQIGNRLYFVENARSYLKKIEESNALDLEDEQSLQSYQLTQPE